AIESDIVSVWDSIKDFFTRTLGDIVGGVGRFVGGLVSTVVNAGKQAFDAAVQFGESIVNGVLHALESLPGKVLGVLKKIPVVGGLISGAGHAVGGVLHSIGLAQGGIVVKPTIALVGEGSEPEAVLPLSQLKQLLAGQPGDIYPAQAGAGPQSKAGGLTIETLNINGRSRTDAQIVSDLWLRLRPFLTAPAY
ncbi:MAG: hypothetical protein ABSB73_11890, partial [Solirubrobacteraceae bacterium]